MADLIWLQRHRVKSILDLSAASIYVAVKHPGLLGVDDLKEKYPSVIMFHVGAQLARPAPCYLYDDCLVVEMSFNAVARQVIIIPWQAILRSDPFVAPQGGGTPISVAA